MQIEVKDHADFGTFEHIIPVDHGGGDALSNLLLAHKTCNGTRGTDRTCIPLFCWARRQFGTDELKIVKYLNSPTYHAAPPEGPRVHG